MSCAADCGACPSSCGNGACEAIGGDDTCTICPSDCSCGTATCDGVYACAMGCGVDFGCIDACYETGCAAAQDQANPLVDCALMACFGSCAAGLSDPACASCVMTMCSAEFMACGSSC